MKKCIINDIYCSDNAEVRCKKLCRKHYSRLLKYGNPDILKNNYRPRKAKLGENWCSICSSFRSNSEFSKSSDRSNGLMSVCKKCASIRWHKEYDPKKESIRRIEKKYGIKPEEYDTIFKSQNGVCAICLKESKSRLAVDHCHKTKKVRGLLCFRCNSTLGKVEDSKELLLSFINYLK